MSSFTAPLVLEVTGKEKGGQGLFRLHTAFSYDVGQLGSGETIIVPAGFVTDLCTLPRIARPFIATSGKAGKAAVLHDYLLSTNDPRAHDVFDEALRVAEVSTFSRVLLVRAVRLYAWWKSALN